MPIRFIPNDPAASRYLPAITKKPRADRATNVAHFVYDGPRPTERSYAANTDEFLYWQSREAALATVETWETIIKTSLKQWHANIGRPLPLKPLGAGVDINAYYDRESLLFSQFLLPRRQRYLSGASTDIVAHEVGHALLDSIRPKLFDSLLLEVGAFHEAFGDCIAILTAMHQKECCELLCKGTDALSRKNAVETFGEDMARAAGIHSGKSEGTPRRALNEFSWAFPTMLPTKGTSAKLTAESHSFSRVFTGCFYDLIREIAGKAPTRRGLLRSAQVAGSLLISAAARATIRERFFESVGRAMLLADEEEHASAYAEKIRSSFARHGVSLGPATANLPVFAAAQTDGSMVRYRKNARREIAHVRKIAGSQFVQDEPYSVRAAVLDGHPVSVVQRMLEIPLDSLGARFKGVVARVPQQITVASTAKAASVVGTMLQSESALDEIRAFVESLVSRKDIETGSRLASAARSPSQKQLSSPASLPTHAITKEQSKQVLRRLRFACSCVR